MSSPRLLLIDNYDSFAHNLARYATLAGARVDIVRNDACTIQDIEAGAPDGIILSPGPCAPKDAGICVDLIRVLGSRIPMLGVCLGHQAIGEAYGGQTAKAPAPMHGRTSMIQPTGDIPLFAGLDAPFAATRYHSLIADISSAPDLQATAFAQGCGTLMAVQHKTHPVHGIQFHPESILTPCGQQIVQNFVRLC